MTGKKFVNEITEEKLRWKSYVLTAKGHWSLVNVVNGYKYFKYSWLAVHGFSAHNAGYEDLGGVDGEQLGEGARVGGAVRELAQHQHGVPHAEAGDAHLPLHTHTEFLSRGRGTEVWTQVWKFPGREKIRGSHRQKKEKELNCWSLEEKQDKKEETEDKN